MAMRHDHLTAMMLDSPYFIEPARHLLIRRHDVALPPLSCATQATAPPHPSSPHLSPAGPWVHVEPCVQHVEPAHASKSSPVVGKGPDDLQEVEEDLHDVEVDVEGGDDVVVGAVGPPPVAHELLDVVYEEEGEEHRRHHRDHEVQYPAHHAPCSCMCCLHGSPHSGVPAALGPCDARRAVTVSGRANRRVQEWRREAGGQQPQGAHRLRQKMPMKLTAMTPKRMATRMPPLLVRSRGVKAATTQAPRTAAVVAARAIAMTSTS